MPKTFALSDNLSPKKLQELQTAINSDSEKALKKFFAKPRFSLFAKPINLNPGYKINDRPLIIVAAQEGRNNLAQILLNQPALDLAAKDREGNTALMHAVKNKDQAMVRALLAKNNSKEILNAKNNEGISAIILAAKNGDAEILQDLIEAGCDVDLQDNYGRTALMEAALKGSAQCVENLVNNQADVHLQDFKGMPALVFATLENVKNILLQSNAGLSKDAWDASEILHLSYSQERHGSDVNITVSHVNDSLKNIDFEYKDTFTSVLDSIAKGNVIGTPEGSIRVVKLPYPNHAAFCVIAYDKFNIPQTISYCDGNMPFAQLDDSGRGQGEAVFKVDSSKLNGQDIASLINRSFRNVSFSNKSQISNAISAVAQCDENNVPVLTSSSPFLTKPQKRGNCSLKSTNIALRAILSRIDPQLAESFKDYKKAITDYSKETLLKMLDLQYKDLSFYPMLVESANSCFLQAAAKDDLEFMSKIKDVLQAAGSIAQDLANIKNKEHGENALYIAIKRGNHDAAGWLLQNGIELLPNKDGIYPFGLIIENPRLVVRFAANKNFMEKFGSEIFLAAINANDLDVAKYLQENGSCLDQSDNRAIIGAINGFRKARKIDAEFLQSLMTTQNVAKSIDNRGFTLLHWACDVGRADIVEAVIGLNKNVINVKDAKGRTALDILRSKNNPALKNLENRLERVGVEEKPSSVPHVQSGVSLQDAHKLSGVTHS